MIIQPVVLNKGVSTYLPPNLSTSRSDRQVKVEWIASKSGFIVPHRYTETFPLWGEEEIMQLFLFAKNISSLQFAKMTLVL